MSVTLHIRIGELRGNLKLELECELCPKTCENFLALSASGAYDHTVFHRNLKGYLIQGGDPTGTGKVSTSIWNTEFGDELVDSLVFDKRGLMAMAVPGRNQNGSQFLITYDAVPNLNHTCTIFGKVVAGFETLDRMEQVETDEQTDRPKVPIVIESITIHANPIAAKQG